MIVILDVDDVQMPWVERVHQECMSVGLTDKTTWTTWGMWDDYGCTRDEWLAVVNTLAVPGGMYHSPPYPGVIESVKKLVAKGHEVHHVTARGFFAHADLIRAWTADWFQTYDIPGTLTFAQDKGAEAKRLGATHSLDDRIENAISLRDAGCMSYLMTQPHNLNDNPSGIRRVQNLPEFVERILR